MPKTKRLRQITKPVSSKKFAGITINANGNSNNPHLPHNHSRDEVIYTGTHDNDTIMGWFRSLGGHDSDRGRTILAYLGSDGWAPQWDFIRFALGVNSIMTITPLQDLLGLGSDARMNIPGQPDGNWGWRLQAEMLTDGHLSYLRQLTQAAGRLGPDRQARSVAAPPPGHPRRSAMADLMPKGRNFH